MTGLLSLARGDYNEKSDIDILVDFNGRIDESIRYGVLFTTSFKITHSFYG